MKDFLDDNSNGSWVCPLEAAPGLEVLQELQALCGTASAVLRQSCKMQRAAHKQLTPFVTNTYLIWSVGGRGE